MFCCPMTRNTRNHFFAGCQRSHEVEIRHLNGITRIYCRKFSSSAQQCMHPYLGHDAVPARINRALVSISTALPPLRDPSPGNRLAAANLRSRRKMNPSRPAEQRARVQESCTPRHMQPPCTTILHCNTPPPSLDAPPRPQRPARALAANSLSEGNYAAPVRSTSERFNG